MTVLHQIRQGARSIENLLNAPTGWPGPLLRAALLALPLLLFFWVAFGDVPTGLSIELRAKNPIILLLLGLIFLLAYRLPGWLGVLGGLSATLLVFAMELATVWLTAESDGDVIISGLLPWSDASQYYFGAQLLVEDGQLTPWHGRRPWFMSLLAVLLGASQENLQWSIAVLVAITAVACFIFARTVQVSLGTASAVTALLTLLLFYSRFIGTTMSEHLGFALGAIALAVLWQSAQGPRLGRLWLVGLWLLTIALTARAGAFFVLPALLVWGAWHSYLTVSRRESLKILLMGGAAIGVGFMMDAVLRRTLVPEALPFGNFSYTLYGLVVGNKGWLQARQDHPEILSLDEIDAARHVYQLAFKAFLADPWSAVSGALGAWQDFFSYALGLFSFIPGGEARYAAYVLSGLGFVNCLWHWRVAQCSMILAMAAGVLLSVPFVPPVDAYSMRIYAATIPLNALLVALGVVPALSIVGVSALPHLAMSRRVAPACGALLVLVAFVGSISLRLLNQPETFAPLPCPPEQVNLYVRMTEGSSIHVVEDKARRQSHVPEVRVSDFRNGLGAYQKWYPSLYAELGNVRAGQELRLAMNLARDRHGQPLWLISDAQATPRTGVARICARLADNKIANFYYAQEIQAVSESNL